MDTQHVKGRCHEYIWNSIRNVVISKEPILIKDINENEDVLEANDYDRVEEEDSFDGEEVSYSNNKSEAFPTLLEPFEQEVEDLINRKAKEKQDPVPKPTEEEVKRNNEKWFKTIKSKRKFLRSFKFFIQDRGISQGYIISWKYIEKLRCLAARRELGV
ncbi:hypothetical protein Hanom_Chr00s001439g01682481 [Helianthus anomalus]